MSTDEVCCEECQEPVIHKQKQASRAMVDEGLVELLEVLWARGIDTDYSCEGGDEDRVWLSLQVHSVVIADAYVSFVRFDDAVALLRELTEALGDNPLYFTMRMDANPADGTHDEMGACLRWNTALTPEVLKALS